MHPLHEGRSCRRTRCKTNRGSAKPRRRIAQLVEPRSGLAIAKPYRKRTPSLVAPAPNIRRVRCRLWTLGASEPAHGRDLQDQFQGVTLVTLHMSSKGEGLGELLTSEGHKCASCRSQRRTFQTIPGRFDSSSGIRRGSMGRVWNRGRSGDDRLGCSSLWHCCLRALDRKRSPIDGSDTPISSSFATADTSACRCHGSSLGNTSSANTGVWSSSLVAS